MRTLQTMRFPRPGAFGVSVKKTPSDDPWSVFVAALLSGRYGGHMVPLWPVHPACFEVTYECS